METQAIAFDTHAFAKRLTGAGMPEDQATILAKGQSDLYERLLTQDQIIPMDQFFFFKLAEQRPDLLA